MSSRGANRIRRPRWANWRARPPITPPIWRANWKFSRRDSASTVVPGNHDLWDGDFGPVADILARANVVSLLNTHTRLPQGLPLIGVDDLRAGYPDPGAATAGVPSDEAQIILSHNPRLALLFRARNALVLSGHTHGGQVALPARFRVAPVDAGQSFYQRGWYQVGRAKLYVSCGAGTIGVPMRLGVRPEIAVFTLRTVTASG